MRKLIGFVLFLAVAILLVWGAFRLLANEEVRATVMGIPTPSFVEVLVPVTEMVTTVTLEPVTDTIRIEVPVTETLFLQAGFAASEQEDSLEIAYRAELDKLDSHEELQEGVNPSVPPQKTRVIFTGHGTVVYGGVTVEMPYVTPCNDGQGSECTLYIVVLKNNNEVGGAPIDLTLVGNPAGGTSIWEYRQGAEPNLEPLWQMPLQRPNHCGFNCTNVQLIVMEGAKGEAEITFWKTYGRQNEIQQQPTPTFSATTNEESTTGPVVPVCAHALAATEVPAGNVLWITMDPGTVKVGEKETQVDSRSTWAIFGPAQVAVSGVNSDATWSCIGDPSLVEWNKTDGAPRNFLFKDGVLSERP